MFVTYTVLIFVTVFSFIVAVIIHELGHIIFGKLMKFKIIYIELFGCQIKFKTGKFLFKLNPRINAKTCMYPKGICGILFRTVVYYLGGLVLNTFMLLICYVSLPKENYITIIFKIMLIWTLIFGILPYKGSDIDNIKSLLKKEGRIYIFIQFYMMNNITPGNMPGEWFEIIKKKSFNLENLYLHKIYYYRLLEKKESKEEIKSYFNQLYPLLLKTKFLTDKCEILFYYSIIERNENMVLEIRKKIDILIDDSNISCKKRMMLVRHRAYGGSIKEILEKYKIISEVPGIISLEEIIINNFILNWGA